MTKRNMLLFLFIFLGHLTGDADTAILLCDFETPCLDFNVDKNWGFTDGLHPEPIEHDHTLNSSAGHYLFYSPQKDPPFYSIDAVIETRDWIQPPTDRATCFQMWYFTPHQKLPFNIQLVQGDDERLKRIVASIPGKDPSIDDWTLVSIVLPPEKIKILIRLNTSTVPLAFDDLSIDYCDEPHPEPPRVLFECDFESSCKDEFVPLPNYQYTWFTMEAGDAAQTENLAPPVDFTFNNRSGHYALVPNAKSAEKGNVGYLSMQTSLNITANESYCLSFQYYGYGRPYVSRLKIYASMVELPESIQQLWPPVGTQTSYIRDRWAWGITNLPVGHYSLLFRIDNTDSYPSSFAIDDISITSCQYAPSTFSDDGGFLSLSCDFDDLTMCKMENDVRTFRPTFNFTVFTGETVPNRELGPLRDHTSNSTTGGFIYWNRHLPFMSTDRGFINPSKSAEVNSAMCIRFAFYVKSSISNKNGTQLGLATGGCLGTVMWSPSLDDSQGWQDVTLPVPNVGCMELFSFQIFQTVTVPVSVAFDDIQIGQCDVISPTTTTTTTTTTSTTTTTTTVTTQSSTTTTTTTTTTVSSTATTTTEIITTTTTSSVPTSTTNQSERSFASDRLHLILLVLMSLLFLLT